MLANILCLFSLTHLLPVLADLATQMRFLTSSEAVDSPQLKRSSKVLSWISESEDLMFEDTGSAGGGDGSE